MAPVIHKLPSQLPSVEPALPSTTSPSSVSPSPPCPPPQSSPKASTLQSSTPSSVNPSSSSVPQDSNPSVPTPSTVTSQRRSSKTKSPRHPTRFSRRLQLLHRIRKLPAPYIAKVVESMLKPEIPPHMGIALKSPYRAEWIEATFNGYEKMHRTSTLSRPFLRSMLPPNALILSPRLSFEVRTTDLDFFYELKVRLCADGSKMLAGVHFDESYSPVCNGSSFCHAICLASVLAMVFYFIDADNAFQTNFIEDPSSRHYLSLPPYYLEWFKSLWPNHPILLHNAKDLVMQTLCNLQGSKDAGNKWYNLLVKIFKSLGMKPNFSSSQSY